MKLETKINDRKMKNLFNFLSDKFSDKFTVGRVCIPSMNSLIKEVGVWYYSS
jgi:hypothetical protein